MLENLERGNKIKWMQVLKQSLEMIGLGGGLVHKTEVCLWGK